MYLTQHEFRKQHFIDKIINNDSDMSFAAVVAGNNIGEVWVDDLLNPSFAIVWSEYLGGFSFMGTSYNNIDPTRLRGFINDTVIAFLKSKGIDSFEFSCDKKSWLPFILNCLSGYSIRCEEQFVYGLDKNIVHNNLFLSTSEYSYIEITPDTLKDEINKLINVDILQNEINKAWYSIDVFLRNGKGFIAIKDNEICSFALTHFRYNNTFSIGVETFDPHKQKGLSSNLTKLLIKCLCEHKGNIWWDCMESNIASQKTAQKAGLLFRYKYTVCWFDI
ncbi:MAG: GNAT family N-acetyltransferase [Oscillospiraceae bacterium]|jgi:hypothetical protein|nr:GNAT family N-acetyltransferase [Oscillospiraceae bacterium]